MKKLLFLMFSLVFLTGCQNSSKQEEEEKSDEDPFFGTSFKDYREIVVLENYEKVKDTSFSIGVSEGDYGLMELMKNGNHIILFYKIAERDSVVTNELTYRVIDTIQIQNLQKNEHITIGYCTHEDYSDGEIIAVIGETDSLYTTNIIEAWRANPDTEKIEELKNIEGIKCLNELLERENATIPIEEIS
ncbi:hypothetical protein [Salinimicrobium terrae]|uniref:hypothetical protein n=1 Tax=Salinimicrobium terrae TaxID=470866 RepID=UPI00048CC4CF|nr:hypothetical protein [Salinimicrobium terrae]